MYTRKSLEEIALETINKIKGNAVQIEENRREIYRISKMLPEDEGYNLLKIFENTVTNVSEAYSKVHK